MDISSQTIAKLGHNIPEIRLRTFDTINKKLLACLSSENSNRLNYNAPFLVKWLIRWFGQEPLYEEAAVLNLILMILKSSSGKDVISTLGIENINKEISKIKRLLRFANDKKLLNEIETLLNDFTTQSKIMEMNTEYGTESFNDEQFSMLDNSETMLNAMYEEAWELPDHLDLIKLQKLNSSLKHETNDSALEYSLLYINVALEDFPAEHFLQPPYIFQTLKKLFSRVTNGEQILEIFSNLIKSLIRRLKMRSSIKTFIVKKEAPKNQLSIVYCSLELFRITLNKIKSICNEGNSKEMYLCFQLLLDLVNIVKYKYIDDWTLNQVLNELGFLAKFFRQFNENDFMNYGMRNNYMICLYLISNLATLKPIATDENQLNDKNIWTEELLISVYDFPLEHIHSTIYQRILEALELNFHFKSTNLTIFAENQAAIVSAIDLLKHSNQMTNDEIIKKGNLAMDTLLILKSTDLSNEIFKAVLGSMQTSSSSLYKCHIEITQRLLAHDDINIKGMTYEMCSNRIKYIIGDLMGCGDSNLQKISVDSAKVFGFPFNKNILTEIILFGYLNKDSKIHSSAEIILNLILKSRHLMKRNWIEMLKIIEPALPLLQCHATKKSDLGLYILDFVYSQNGLTSLQKLQCFIRFLFSIESSIRCEAISHISILLSTHRATAMNSLNIENIADTIPNNICIIEPVDLSRMFVGNTFELSTIFPLMELLRNEEIEPALRKTTLIQLNVMAQDRQLLNIIQSQNGLELMIKILQKSLKDNESLYYPECCVPAVGIILKLCLYIINVRNELSSNEDLHILLLCALILYHSNPAHKVNCALTLYLLTNSEYCIGSSSNITIPSIYTKITVPMKCNTHWHHSPLNQISSLEKMLSNSESHSVDEDANFKTLEFEATWQYFRLLFASLWHGSFEQLTNTINAQQDLYTIDKGQPLSFDNKIKLIKNDAALIEISFPENAIKHWLIQIENATNYTDALLALMQIKKYFLLPGKIVANGKLLIKMFHKFINVLPNNDGDVMVLESILNLLGTLIEKDYKDIFAWILEELCNKNCIFVNLLKKINISSSLYYKNCIFLHKFLIILNRNLQMNDNSNEIEGYSCLCLYLHGKMDETLRNLIETKNFEKLRSLMYLYCTISSLVENLDTENVNNSIGPIFSLLSVMKSSDQTGSGLSKMCLLSIGNLLNSSEKVNVPPKYLKLLAGLCGHIDWEIRLFAWSILLNIGSDVLSASEMIKELSFLPGGLHACCLSTCLDFNEYPVIRGIAGRLFANLISFLDESNMLDISVTPFCIDKEFLNHNSPSASEIIFEIIHLQSFFPSVQEYINTYAKTHIHPKSDLRITIDILGAYCSIMTNLIVINPQTIETIYNSGLILQIARLIPRVLDPIDKSSVRTFSSICKLLLRCFSHESDIVAQIVSHENNVIRMLIRSIDPQYFDTVPESLQVETVKDIVSILIHITRTTFGIQVLLEHLIEGSMSIFLNFLLYAFQYRCDIELNIVALNFLISILTCKTENNEFINLLDSTEIINDNDITKSTRDLSISDHDQRSISGCASEYIFTSLCAFLSLSQKKIKLSIRISKAIALLLNVSDKVRSLASMKQFFLVLITEIENALSQVNAEPCEFIKRFGDSATQKFINQMKMIYGIVLNWYSVDSLIDAQEIAQFCDVSMKIWSWSMVKGDFQIIFLNALVFLSEDSLGVCKAYSHQRIGNSKPLLQRLADLVILKTKIIKSSQHDLDVVRISLRIISNCCSCTEGRFILTKINLLDCLDRLNPSILKHQTSWNEVLIYLLEFYEIFNRYSDYSSVKHLSMLCFFITKSNTAFRTLSMKILRNMSFSSNNKAALLSSDEFLHMLKTVLESGSTDEKFMVLTIIWSLIANSYKNKHKIKCGTLYNKLSAIQENESMLLQQTAQSTEFNYVIEILDFIFKN